MRLADVPPESEHLDILSPREGYDRAAPYYDRWSWQRFWDANELPAVLRAISSIGARSALDVGVGTGRYLEALRKRDIEGTGVDISPDMLRVASRKSDCADHLVEGDVRSLPLRSSTFDLVVAARVLSHVPELDLALSEIGRVLKPGGHAVLTDVDAEHDYHYTRIETPRGDVKISVVKRSLPDLLVEIQASRMFEVLQASRMRANNVSFLPPAHELTSIDRSGRRAIAYTILLRHVC